MITKQFRRALQVAVPLMAALALTGCKVNYSTYSGAGTRVAEVRGAARVSQGQTWRTVREDDTLLPGSLLQTATESAVDIVVDMGMGPANSSRILMQSDSVLAIEGLPTAAPVGGAATSKDILLQIRSGWMTFTSATTGENPLCEVRFDKGLAGSHGATFNIHSDGHIKVLVGNVVLKTFDDQPARTIAAGNQFDPTTGAITLSPMNQPEEPVPAAATPAPEPAPHAKPVKRSPFDPTSLPQRPK